jgi:hypothetical protein
MSNLRKPLLKYPLFSMSKRKEQKKKKELNERGEKQKFGI